MGIFSWIVLLWPWIQLEVKNSIWNTNSQYCLKIIRGQIGLQAIIIDFKSNNFHFPLKLSFSQLGTQQCHYGDLWIINTNKWRQDKGNGELVQEAIDFYSRNWILLHLPRTPACPELSFIQIHETGTRCFCILSQLRRTHLHSHSQTKSQSCFFPRSVDISNIDLNADPSRCLCFEESPKTIAMFWQSARLQHCLTWQIVQTIAFALIKRKTSCIKLTSSLHQRTWQIIAKACFPSSCFIISSFTCDFCTPSPVNLLFVCFSQIFLACLDDR